MLWSQIYHPATSDSHVTGLSSFHWHEPKTSAMHCGLANDWTMIHGGVRLCGVPAEPRTEARVGKQESPMIAVVFA
jgi:hypothetical protein